MKQKRKKVEVNPIIKTSNPAKKAIIQSATALAIIFGGLFLSSNGAKYATNRAEFDKINTALEFYGGIDRYISNEFLGTYVKFSPYNTKDIKFGLDSSISNETEKQLNYCVDYLNDIFSVINSNYHFNIKRTDSTNDCDIFVSNQDLCKKYGSQYANKLAVATNIMPRSIFNLSDYGKAEIVYNESREISNVYKRSVFLHEMMHVLLLTDDLNYDENEKYNHWSVPYSILSYSKQGDIVHSIEDIDKFDIETNEQIKNTFVSYTPFDLAAISARYGDIYNKQNRIACTKQIIDTYKTFNSLFGEKDYFLSDIELNKEGYPAIFDTAFDNKVTANTADAIKKVEDDKMIL